MDAEDFSTAYPTHYENPRWSDKKFNQRFRYPPNNLTAHTLVWSESNQWTAFIPSITYPKWGNNDRLSLALGGIKFTATNFKHTGPIRDNFFFLWRKDKSA